MSFLDNILLQKIKISRLSIFIHKNWFKSCYGIMFNQYYQLDDINNDTLKEISLMENPYWKYYIAQIVDCFNNNNNNNNNVISIIRLELSKKMSLLLPPFTKTNTFCKCISCIDKDIFMMTHDDNALYRNYTHKILDNCFIASLNRDISDLEMKLECPNIIDRDLIIVELDDMKTGLREFIGNKRLKC